MTIYDDLLECAYRLNRLAEDAALTPNTRVTVVLDYKTYWGLVERSIAAAPLTTKQPVPPGASQEPFRVNGVLFRPED